MTKEFYIQEMSMNDPHFTPEHLRERLAIMTDVQYARKSSLTVNAGFVEGPFSETEVRDRLHNHGIEIPDSADLKVGEYSLAKPEWNNWFFGWPQS